MPAEVSTCGANTTAGFSLAMAAWTSAMGAGAQGDWAPGFRNPRVQIVQPYVKNGARVALAFAYYRNQGQESQLISTQNTLVSNADSEWKNVHDMHRTVAIKNQPLALIEARLLSQVSGLVAWRWYWVDGQYTVSPYWAKLLQAKSRLLGRGDDGAVVVLYTGIGWDRDVVEGRLQDFANAMLPGISESLARAHAH